MILTALVLLPAVVATVIALLPAHQRGAIRAVALVGTLATLAVVTAVVVAFQPGQAGFQFNEVRVWVPSYGMTWRLAVDGISLPLVALTGLMFPLAIGAAWHQETRAKGFFASLLALESALLGVFLALDLILFYVFFEIMLVPMYALIGGWGGAQRRYAAVKFFLYTLVGGLLMLVGVLYLYFDAGARSFDYQVIGATVSLTR